MFKNAVTGSKRESNFDATSIGRQTSLIRMTLKGLGHPMNIFCRSVKLTQYCLNTRKWFLNVYPVYPEKNLYKYTVICAPASRHWSIFFSVVHPSFDKGKISVFSPNLLA
jgi:hypothetical protein